MLQVFSLILPIFLVVFTGMVLRRTGMVDERFVQASNRLIFYVFLPALLFHKIALSNFRETFDISYIIILFASITAIGILAYLVARGLKLSAAGTFTTLNIRLNVAFIGLPICFYAFGDNGLALASILLAFSAPFFNILSVVTMNVDKRQKFAWSVFIKENLLNPLIIGSVAGIIFSVVGISLPGFLDRTLTLFDGITLPLALISIGATTRLQGFKGNISSLTACTVIKLFVMPLAAYLLLTAAGFSVGLPEQVLIVMLSSPVSMDSYIVVSEMKGDTDLASSVILSTTILSLFSYTFWLSFLM